MNPEISGSAGIRKGGREYEEGGVERLKELHFYRPLSELGPTASSRRSDFEDRSAPVGAVCRQFDQTTTTHAGLGQLGDATG